MITTDESTVFFKDGQGQEDFTDCAKSFREPGNLAAKHQARSRPSSDRLRFC